MNLFVKRFIAVLIDSLVIGVPVALVEMIFSLFRMILEMLPLLHIFSFLFTTSFLFVIVYAIYEAVMLFTVGDTIGKRIMHLETVSRSGMSFTTCLIRGGLKALSLQIWLLGVASAVVAFMEPHRSIHDMAAGTEVW